MIPFTLNLQQNGSEVTGTIESGQGAFQISSGRYENGLLTIKTTNPIELSFVGTVNGTSVTGNISAPQGTTTFSGSRSN